MKKAILLITGVIFLNGCTTVQQDQIDGVIEGAVGMAGSIWGASRSPIVPLQYDLTPSP